MTTPPVWFVTGASKGIGHATVREALASGACVVATSRDADTLRSEMGVETPQLTAVTMSLTDSESIASAVSTAVETYGRIDVLVNNAGYSLLGAVEELDSADVRANFDVNVFGLLEVTQHVLPTMRRQRSGRILNLASISADVTGPATGLYSATKAAVAMLTEALADEIEPLGLHATAICPGGIRTDFLDASSSRRASKTIDDYDRVRAALAQYDNLNHRQSGKPALVARALLEVAALAQPPRRIYLGSDALHAIGSKMRITAADIQRYDALSRSIDGH